MTELKQMGVNYIAPPMWMLITLEEGKIVPNALAKAAKEADLGIFTWTLERSGFLSEGGGWYFQSVRDVIDAEGDYYEVLDVLAQDVGVKGVFSDWPATVTYYANCMGR
jgi:glycerophosphoryl diester phosphodiesterase